MEYLASPIEVQNTKENFIEDREPTVFRMLDIKMVHMFNDGYGSTGHITNFEYLTQLNKLAGRSFNDLMQYPVFPFVLSNYTADILSLNDPSSFR